MNYSDKKPDVLESTPGLPAPGQAAEWSSVQTATARDCQGHYNGKMNSDS